MDIAILAASKASSNDVQYRIPGSHMSHGSADPSAAPGRIFKPRGREHTKGQCKSLKRGGGLKSFVSVGSYIKPKEGSLSPNSHCREREGFPQTSSPHAGSSLEISTAL